MSDLKKCPKCEDSIMQLCDKEPVDNDGQIIKESVFVCPKCHYEEPFRKATAGAVKIDMETFGKMFNN